MAMKPSFWVLCTTFPCAWFVLPMSPLLSNVSRHIIWCGRITAPNNAKAGRLCLMGKTCSLLDAVGPSLFTYLFACFCALASSLGRQVEDCDNSRAHPCRAHGTLDYCSDNSDPPLFCCNLLWWHSRWAWCQAHLFFHMALTAMIESK